MASKLENFEQRIRDKIGKDVAILKRKGKPFTLKQLREQVDSLTKEEYQEAESGKK